MNGEASRRTYGEIDEITEGIRRRDTRALESLYHRLGQQAFGLAYRILGDGPSAEDVVQEAFLTVWRQAHRLNPSRGTVTAFLMTVVHHKAIDLLRMRRGQRARLLPLDLAAVKPQETEILEMVTDSLGREAMRSALQSLPPEQRESIELAYFEGLTHAEIAQALGLPLGTVKSRLRLGLKKLRSLLGIEATQ